MTQYNLFIYQIVLQISYLYVANKHQRPLLRTWINFSPIMDK